MSNDVIMFLNLRHLPARLTAQQAAWLLGCKPEDMPILVARKIAKYLGDPQQSATKYFAQVEILSIAACKEKMAKVTQTIYSYWKGKNSRRRKNSDSEYREAA